MSRLLLALLALGMAAPGAHAGDAVTFQLDASHTGAAREPGLDPPLRRAWTRRFAGPPAYPLIVGGRVFVAVSPGDRPGTRLFALSARTGRTLWQRHLGITSHGHPAYHGGRLFVLDGDANLFAFDARSGRELWRIESEFGITNGQPVGFEGVLYLVLHDMVRALDPSTGREIWASVINGTDSTAPAVTTDRVFASFAGPQVYAFDRASGAELWHPYESIHGGGGATPALYRGRLYVREGGRIHVYAATDGALVGRFRAEDYIEPAFAFGTAYVLDEVARERVWKDGGALVAVDLDRLRPRWRFRGDGWLQSSALVVNRTVYVGSATGRLYGVDARTGRLRWRTHLAEGVSSDGFGSGDRAFAAGRGLLVVPATRRLVAFR